MSDSWGRNLSKVSDFYLKVLSYAGMTAAAHRITDVLSLLAGLTVWLKQSNLMDWNSIRQWFGHTCAERKKRSWVDPKKTSVCFFIWLTGRLSKDVSIGGQILHMLRNWIFDLFTFQSQKGAKPSSHLDGVRRGWSFVSANNAYYPSPPTSATHHVSSTFQTVILKCCLKMEEENLAPSVFFVEYIIHVLSRAPPGPAGSVKTFSRPD